MKMVLAALAAAIVCVQAASVSPAGATDAKELANLQDQVLASSVIIGDFCSGEIIWSKRAPDGKVETLVLTAKHCINDMKVSGTGWWWSSTTPANLDFVDITVPVYDKNLSLIAKRVYPAFVLEKTYGDQDVALLQLRDSDTFFPKTIRIAKPDTQLMMGEDTWAVGYPRIESLTITKGTLGPRQVLKLQGDITESRRSSNEIAPGSSGGGLYHRDDAGNFELIGIAYANWGASPFMSYFNSLEDILAFLKRARPAVYNEMFPAPATAAGPAKSP